jgi:hypothetical protein
MISLSIAWIVGSTASVYLYIRWSRVFSRAFRRLMLASGVDKVAEITAFEKASKAKRKQNIALGFVSALHLSGIVLANCLAFEGNAKLIALALPSAFFLTAFAAGMLISSRDNRFDEMLKDEKLQRISEFSV